MSPSFEDSAVACAENIALFAFLHSASNSGPIQSVPFPPSSNELCHSSHKEGYVLPLGKERRLVGVLAFLAQTKDDPDHIPAVCVQHNNNPSVLSVLLAVNKHGCDDGDTILRDRKQRFDKIFSILSRVSDRRDDTSSVEEEVFAEIISMCLSRILQRLRLIPKKKNKTQKKPIKDVLQTATECVKHIKAEDKDLQSAKAIFAMKSKEVIRLVDLWHGHQTATRLGDLVEGVYRLWQVAKLDVVLDLIPTSSMERDAKRGLLNIIGKVSRYRQAARLLYRTAKKVPLARKMKTVTIKLPPEAYGHTLAGIHTPVLQSTLTRIDQEYNRPKSLSRLCSLLDTTTEEAAKQFSGQVRRTLREAKIHAEIQLITYCELQKPRLPPRVVCSSKDACFLCNTFILMYKGIHTPRCHGRLYPGWHLPPLLQLRGMEQRFIKVMDTHIRQSLSMISSRRRKTLYPCPNESTLLTLPVSETTKCSSTRFVVSEADIHIPTSTMTKESSSQSMLRGARELPTSPQLTSTPLEPISDIGGAGDTLQPGHLSASSQSPQLRNIPVDKFVLSRGVKIFGRVNPNGMSALYVAGPLQMAVEYIPRSESFVYSIEWLRIEDVERAQKEGSLAPLVNAEIIAGEIVVQDQSSLFIVAGGATLRLDWHPKI